jgi:hypothetical protein
MVINAICCGGLMLLLGACNVGSDEGQQSTSASASQTFATTSSQYQISKPVADNTSPAASHSETYYLLLHGLNAEGKPVTNAYAFQKYVNAPGNQSVQLIWFEPNRTADGTCLHGLNGYELEYGMQPGSYNIRLRFDLASRDMTCMTVGTTECGDVRECRYNLSL